ncbi:ATP-binding protein [Filobacillus milosensis]|nr:ATP-binding protein [Filobacillus milosensis]
MKRVETYCIYSMNEYKKVRKMIHETLVDYFSGDKMLVDLALFEAVKNAMEHGNQGNSNNPIEIKLHFLDHSLIARIEDQGKGSNWQDDLDKNGEGLHLIGQIMDSVVYSKKGNQILMRKWVS